MDCVPITGRYPFKQDRGGGKFFDRSILKVRRIIKQSTRCDIDRVGTGGVCTATIDFPLAMHLLEDPVRLRTVEAYPFTVWRR